MGRSQVSGSLSLDLSAVAEGVAETLRPSLAALQDSLDRIAGSPLNQHDMAETLHRHLAGAIEHAGGTAAHLARELTAAGYALMKLTQDPAPASPEAGSHRQDETSSFWDGTQG